jgi:hypothetical protein
MTDSGYVEVRDEPRHHHRFENAFVRVYEALIAAGDTTLYHRHQEDTFYAAIAPARVRSQVWGEAEVREGEVAAGRAFCNLHRAEPLIHQVTNVGATGMRMLGAEVKASPPNTSSVVLEAPGHEVLWEGDRLRIYELVLEPQASLDAVEYGFSGLTVVLTPSSLQIRDRGGERMVLRNPGDVAWESGPRTQSVTNLATVPYRALIAEWR